MNRRGFIRSALAATLGLAAGTLVPSTPVETFTQTENFSTVVFKEIKFIEDADCPEGMIFFLPADFKWKVSK